MEDFQGRSRDLVKRILTGAGERIGLKEVQEALVNDIERYIKLTQQIETMERLQRTEKLAEIDARRHDLHLSMRSQAARLGVDDEKLFNLMEIRIRDELAKTEISSFSMRASTALGVPVTVSDSELVSQFIRKKSLFSGPRELVRIPEQREPRYTIVFRFYTTYAEPGLFGEGDKPEFTDADIKRVEHVLRGVATALGATEITYQESLGHFAHHMDYLGDDWYAWIWHSRTLSFPKTKTSDVFKEIERLATMRKP